MLLLDVLGGQEIIRARSTRCLPRSPGRSTIKRSKDSASTCSRRPAATSSIRLRSLFVPQCWMSYNAALRAINLGYTNVPGTAAASSPGNRPGCRCSAASRSRRMRTANGAAIAFAAVVAAYSGSHTQPQARAAAVCRPASSASKSPKSSISPDSDGRWSRRACSCRAAGARRAACSGRRGRARSLRRLRGRRPRPTAPRAQRSSRPRHGPPAAAARAIACPATIGTSARISRHTSNGACPAPECSITVRVRTFSRPTRTTTTA